MRLFAPRKESVTVTFLIPLARDEGKPVRYREETRDFVVMENLRPQAAEFMGLLNGLGQEDSDQLLNQLVQHALAHPVEGNQPTLDEVGRLCDTDKIGIIDLQGDLYGFRKEEERLGKKLEPLVRALRLSSLYPVEKTTPGPTCATPSEPDSE